MQLINYDVVYGRTLEILKIDMDLAEAKTWLNKFLTEEFIRGNFVEMTDKANYFEPEGGVTCHVIVTKTQGANEKISHHLFERMTYAQAEEIWQMYWFHNSMNSRFNSKQTAQRSDFVDEPESCFDEW